ncbi:hypothetical protein D7X94_02870 [Acutalibacter sp. 1XD8-33]|nr:hypothetical protein D7X94_02870 [Acutalibacter sp. 1XD8-33]
MEHWFPLGHLGTKFITELVFNETRPNAPLYDTWFEHDACGIGAVVDIKGRKSHRTVDDALAKMSRIQQRGIRSPDSATRGLEFNRKLYVVRRVFKQSDGGIYVASLSSCAFGTSRKMWSTLCASLLRDECLYLGYSSRNCFHHNRRFKIMEMHDKLFNLSYIVGGICDSLQK